MIELTRLNDTKIWINPFLLEFMEETPDTVLIFNSGKKFVVKEKTTEIQNKFIEFLSESIKVGIIKAKGD